MTQKCNFCSTLGPDPKWARRLYNHPRNVFCKWNSQKPARSTERTGSGSVSTSGVRRPAAPRPRISGLGRVRLGAGCVCRSARGPLLSTFLPEPPRLHFGLTYSRPCRIASTGRVGAWQRHSCWLAGWGGGAWRRRATLPSPVLSLRAQLVGPTQSGGELEWRGTRQGGGRSQAGPGP